MTVGELKKALEDLKNMNDMEVRILFPDDNPLDTYSSITETLTIVLNQDLEGFYIRID